MNLKEVDINIEEWEMVEIPFYTEEELTYRLKNDLPITKSEFEEQESKITDRTKMWLITYI